MPRFCRAFAKPLSLCAPPAHTAWAPRAPPDFVSEEIGLAMALVLDAGGQTDHKLSSRLKSVDFEGAAKLADS